MSISSCIFVDQMYAFYRQLRFSLDLSYLKTLSVNRRERDHRGDLGVDGWIILGWISSRWDVGVWTGLGWPRIQTGGGRL